MKCSKVLSEPQVEPPGRLLLARHDLDVLRVLRLRTALRFGHVQLF